MVSFARQCYLIAMLTFSVQRTVNNIAYWLMISSCCFNYVVTYSTLVFGGTIIVNTAISMTYYVSSIISSANTSICVSVLALISVYYAIRMHGRCAFKLLVAIYGVHMFVKILTTKLTMIMSRNCRFQSIRGMNLSRSRNQAVRFPDVSCGDNHARLVQYLGRSKRILVVCFAYFTDIVSYVTGSFTVERNIFFLMYEILCAIVILDLGRTDKNPHRIGLSRCIGYLNVNAEGACCLHRTSSGKNSCRRKI